jgi:CubicO group peptidase (beta-lactamase class C family)
MITRREWSLGLLVPAASAVPPAARWPGAHWEQREPASLGLDAGQLEALATGLGGNGCVIKDGYLAMAWGDQSAKRDWLSSVKPVFSTLLFFAIQEKLLKSVDAPLAGYGWALREKDLTMTFRHLADMTSGYARPEAPGRAYAYNDYAIQLYQLTLFDRLYREAPETVAHARTRLGALEFEDGLTFTTRRRLLASVRDFARIGWFWLHQGRWGGRQVLDRSFFRKHLKPDVPFDLPHTQQAGNDDYLQIGTFGGGSDHFTKFGPGIYGFNWWFNKTSRLHPRALTWPDAPRDTILSIGAGGNCCAVIPSRGLVLASSRGDWGALAGGDTSAPMNLHLQRLAGAVRARAA